MVVKCVASIHDSSTGGVVGTLTGDAYIGGSASDLPGSAPAPNVMTANALQAHAATPPPGGSGQQQIGPPYGKHITPNWYGLIICGTDVHGGFDLPKPGLPNTKAWAPEAQAVKQRLLNHHPHGYCSIEWVTDLKSFVAAFNSYSDLNCFVYIGHGEFAGAIYVTQPRLCVGSPPDGYQGSMLPYDFTPDDLPMLNKSVMSNSAEIYLYACTSGLLAQDFANYFDVPTLGYISALDWGVPMSNPRIDPFSPYGISAIYEPALFNILGH
jgi:hypothetical protein